MKNILDEEPMLKLNEYGAMLEEIKAKKRA